MSVAKKPDGGPAFPVVGEILGLGCHGMTLRDYLAAHARIEKRDVLFSLRAAGVDNPTPEEFIRARAVMRWFDADAMIAERDK